MLSDKTSILQLTSLLHQHNVADVVLCPGSRNAPICHTLNISELFTCHPITDERSAGFVALGIALATQRPVAVCVTSGSALANLHPAVCEAFYQQVPIIVISADRPAAWIGQMDGQTMPQPKIFGSMVKADVCLPEVTNDEEAWYCNRLINEALLECTHHTNGPVHINVPISEPLYTFSTGQLPDARVIKRVTAYDDPELYQLQKDCKNAAIIIGQLPPGGLTKTEILSEAQENNYAIIAETLSNIDADYIDANPAEIDWEKMQSIDLVITMGGHIINKQMKQWLRTHQPKQHWHVSPDGAIADLFCCQTLCIEARPAEFINNMPLREMDYLDIPFHRTTRVPFIFEELLEQLPENAVLHLANSSTVRYAQCCEMPPTTTVCCNRGINGIEGSMSSAVGYAMATPQKPNFLVIGDLAFFYDQNALWNTALPDNLHILLLNNGGGEIFNTLPIPSDKKSRSIICATHHTTAQSVCQQYGLKYLCGEDALDEFVAYKKSVILEIKD